MHKFKRCLLGISCLRRGRVLGLWQGVKPWPWVTRGRRLLRSNLIQVLSSKSPTLCPSCPFMPPRLFLASCSFQNSGEHKHETVTLTNVVPTEVGAGRDTCLGG